MYLPVMKNSKLLIGLSLFVMVVGLISLAVQGLNLGIDFTGGTLLDLSFDKPITTAQVTDVLAQYGLDKSSKVQLVGDHRALIRTVKFDSETKRAEILKTFKATMGNYKIERIEKVGPIIGQELTKKALLAVLIATIAMIVYITWRFEFKFAVCGILALLHDSVIVVGLFSLFQVEVDSSFIAAILTLLGYSINDTIVVYDRIRENLHSRRRESLGQIVDDSINQTLRRSINTSVTVMLTILALIFFGGETIQTFCIALAIGVFSGTYSSIFIASPAWVYWHNWTDPKGKGKKKVATA